MSRDFLNALRERLRFRQWRRATRLLNAGEQGEDGEYLRRNIQREKTELQRYDKAQARFRHS